MTLALCFVNISNAQDPFIGEVRMFACNFAPTGWAKCEGQLLLISQNTALFSLLGTTYGGDGQTTFKLPDLRGRAPIHYSQGAGLPNYTQGQTGGTTSFNLNSSQMPSHSHSVTAVSADGTSASPTNNYPAQTKTLDPEYATGGVATTMNTNMIGNTGGGQSVNHRSPYNTVTFIIALTGLYPSPN